MNQNERKCFTPECTDKECPCEMATMNHGEECTCEVCPVVKDDFNPDGGECPIFPV